MTDSTDADLRVETRYGKELVARSDFIDASARREKSACEVNCAHWHPI